MAATRSRLLVLWDIDHTLIETRGVGRRLYEAAFQAVSGRRVVHQVEVTGKTEQAIFAETLRQHDITPTDALSRAYAAELTRQYEQHQGELGAVGRALPGTAQTLAKLATMTGVVNSVLTGNLRTVARIKLDTYGLSQYVDLNVGAYGDDDPDRARLVAIAQGRAHAGYGDEFNHHNTVLVGDSVNDVIAAHEGGARILAVATGRDNADDLHAAGADTVLPGLTQTQAVIAALTA